MIWVARRIAGIDAHCSDASAPGIGFPNGPPEPVTAGRAGPPQPRPLHLPAVRGVVQHVPPVSGVQRLPPTPGPAAPPPAPPSEHRRFVEDHRRRGRQRPHRPRRAPRQIRAARRRDRQPTDPLRDPQPVHLIGELRPAVMSQPARRPAAPAASAAPPPSPPRRPCRPGPGTRPATRHRPATHPPAAANPPGTRHSSAAQPNAASPRPEQLPPHQQPPVLATPAHRARRAHPGAVLHRHHQRPGSHRRQVRRGSPHALAPATARPGPARPTGPAGHRSATATGTTPTDPARPGPPTARPAPGAASTPAAAPAPQTSAATRPATHPDPAGSASRGARPLDQQHIPGSPTAPARPDAATASADVALRCAVDTNTNCGHTRSGWVGSIPSSTTTGATFHASSTTAQRRRSAVHAQLRAHQPLRTVDAVSPAARSRPAPVPLRLVPASPTPGRSLHLRAHRQLLAGVQHLLRLPEPGRLMHPPPAQLPQPPRLAALAGHRQQHHQPHQRPAASCSSSRTETSRCHHRNGTPPSTEAPAISSEP